MKFNSIGRIILAVVLSISLIATGCSVQWISVAPADLPVLTQMALNIAALIATLQSGEQLSPTEALDASGTWLCQTGELLGLPRSTWMDNSCSVAWVIARRLRDGISLILGALGWLVSCVIQG